MYNNEFLYNVNTNHYNSQSYQFQKLKICSLNTNGVKRNLSYIQELISKNDFIFLCETWLLEHEISFLKSLSSTHLVIANSDMKITPLRGRPFGGRAFIFKKSFNVLTYSFVNKHISIFSFSFHNKIFTLITVYLPFDNNSFLNFCEFKSNLQIINELFNFYSLKNHSFFVLGDFNADLKRNNRFDFEFKNYLIDNDLFCISPSLNYNEFSYHNGEYRATLDHCLASASEWNMLVSSSFLDDIINLSDHKPIQVCITFNKSNRIFNFFDKNNCDNEVKTITLLPNLENEEINKKFNRILLDQMKQYENIQIDDSSNKQAVVNMMYVQLTSSIKFAFDSCSSTTTMRESKKKKWFTNELKTIKNKMLNVRYKMNKNQNDIEELKMLKKKFKNVMKKSIFFI